MPWGEGGSAPAALPAVVLLLAVLLLLLLFRTAISRFTSLKIGYSLLLLTCCPLPAPVRIPAALPPPPTAHDTSL